MIQYCTYTIYKYDNNASLCITGANITTVRFRVRYPNPGTFGISIFKFTSLCVVFAPSRCRDGHQKRYTFSCPRLPRQLVVRRKNLFR